MITVEQLQKICTSTPKTTLQKFVKPLNTTLKKYNIDTTNRKAAFIAQVAHESGGFVFTIENLNYSAEALLRVFPRHFQNASVARAYARNPEKIANRAYANRMGNGPESSGDGFKFCGRGLIQLTGKSNYEAFAKDFKMTLDEAIKYLETPDGATMSAGWFWDNRDLNRFADTDEIVLISKKVNGGVNGLQERVKYYNLGKTLF